MKVIDPGHYYILDSIDANVADIPRNDVQLYFVKRIGDGYPGNGDTSYSGPICQEVIRALIDRVKHLDGQRPHRENERVVHHLRKALRHLEYRAARERDDEDAIDRLEETDVLELEPTCRTCGHLFCRRHP